MDIKENKFHFTNEEEKKKLIEAGRKKVNIYLSIYI